MATEKTVRTVLSRHPSLRVASSGDAMRIRRATAMDYQFWLGKESWHKSEAALLFAGLEPDSVRESEAWDPESFPRLGDAIFQKEEAAFESWCHIIERAVRSNRLPIAGWGPVEWINWTKALNLTIPSELAQAFIARNNDQSSECGLDGALSASDRSGAPGRPTTIELAVAEFERRIKAKSFCHSLKDEGNFLENWLQKKFPNLRNPKSKAIQNKIRERHRTAKAAPKIK